LTPLKAALEDPSAIRMVAAPPGPAQSVCREYLAGRARGAQAGPLSRSALLARRSLGKAVLHLLPIPERGARRYSYGM
jgi:hypothetical protein